MTLSYPSPTAEIAHKRRDGGNGGRVDGSHLGSGRDASRRSLYPLVVDVAAAADSIGKPAA
jgi:hypothetical protein